MAKPVLDIAVGVDPFPLPEDKLAALAVLGCDYRGENGVQGRQFFRTNPRTRHLHVMAFGSDGWRRYLAFRDYLRAHPEVARDYGQLKRTLAERYRSERARYTEAKTEFVNAVLRRAVAEISKGSLNR
jgi:GrpB-like predicted nucleotidyltransferase (UPF0157 family)